MKEKVENIKEIIGTPYKVGEKVTLLADVKIGNRIYEKGDYLNISKIYCVDEYYGEEMQMDRFAELSYLFSVVLTDGKNMSEETNLDCFLVGEHNDFEIDIFSQIVANDRKTDKKAKIKKDICGYIPIPIICTVAFMLACFLNNDTLKVVFAMAGFCFTLIVFFELLTEIEDNCNIEAKRAIETSFLKSHQEND